MDVGMNTGTENNNPESSKNQRWRSHSQQHPHNHNHALSATLEIMRTKSIQRANGIKIKETQLARHNQKRSSGSTTSQKNNNHENLTNILEHDPNSSKSNEQNGNDVSLLTATTITNTNSSLMDDDDDDENDDDCNSTASTEGSAIDDENDTPTELLELAAFLNVHCSLEKRGPQETKERVIGREHALEKLEQKAALLREAGRRNVELGEVFLMRCGDETRSLIKIKIKFLTFRYGITLRWENGLVNFIVLYKMAPDSFLLDDTAHAHTHTTELPPVVVDQHSNSNSSGSFKKGGKSKSKINSPRFLYIDHTHDTCTVVLQTRNTTTTTNDDSSRQNQAQIGTEVTILQPPWLISRPTHFKPPAVHVTVLKAQGLRNTIGAVDPLGMMSTLLPIHSYVKVSTSRATHRTKAVKMKRSPVWDILDDNYAELEIDYEQDRFLKVEICDHHSKPMKNRRLSVVYVPMAMVPRSNNNYLNNYNNNGGVTTTHINRAEEAQLQQQSNNNNNQTIITMPCRMRKSMGGSYGSITLALSTHDARRDWLQRELQARQNQLEDNYNNNNNNAARCLPNVALICDGNVVDVDLVDDVQEFAAWFRSWCMMMC